MATIPTWVKLVVPLLLGVLAAATVWFILPTMWYGCDIEPQGGGGGFARGMFVLVTVPAVFVVTTVATSLTFSLMPNRQRWAPYATVVVAVLVVLVSITVVHDPGGEYPNPKCPSGTPPWARILG